MSELVTVGIDLAKSIFQIHGVDESGRVLVRRQLRRSQLLAFRVLREAAALSNPAWGLAEALTTGGAGFRVWGMTFG